MPRRHRTPLAAFLLVGSVLVSLPTPPADAAGVLIHQITRVSVASDGSQADDNAYTTPAMSSDGTKIAYNTQASLHPNDTRAGDDVYVHDTATGITSLLSVSSDGTQGNGESSDPSVSSDGTTI